MGDTAAFFDLDRTLLRGASGPIITEALKAVGVLPQRTIPGESLVYGIYNLVGETRPSMALTKRMARAARGWVRESVQEAGRHAGKALANAVQPYAKVLVDEHRSAGRRVVLATTTPYDLVSPLAEELGFDDVIATRYGEKDGRYDGTIHGDFVWGPGKLAAARLWADQHGVSVEDSWAYSDSYFDAPLLGAVAHPYAVNPDPRLLVLATLRRWPILHLDVPPGVPKIPGLNIEPQQIAIALARPELIPYARWDIDGTDKLPKSGPAIIVANHRSYFDTLAVGLTVAQSGRPVRFLGKKEVFDAPIVGQMARAMGGIRVERGTGSDEPLKAAAQALEAGEMVALMPQGTIPRGRAFFEPELQGRWGAAKLAAMTKAPVVPLGLWGTEKVWPRNAKLPNVLNITSPPLVRTRVGDPVKLYYKDLDADTKRIMAAIVDLLPPEARERREPTEAELRATLPSGYKGDPNAEVTRRPGTDI